MICPNKSLEEWKKLDELVPDVSYLVWGKLDGAIDKNGHPMIQVDRFNSLMKANNNDYTKTYSQFIRDIDSKKIQFTRVEQELKDSLKSSRYANSAKDILNLPTTPLDEKTFLSNMYTLDRMNLIRNKALQKIMVKDLIMSQRKGFDKEDALRNEEFISKLKERDAEQALNLYLNQASKSTNILKKEFETFQDQLKEIEDGKSDKTKKDIISLNMLCRWRDLLSAYDSLDDFRDALIDQRKFDKDDPESIARKNLLNNTIAQRDYIKNLYETYGLDMTAEFLADHYDRFYNEYGQQQSLIYDKLSPEDKSKYTKQEWIKLAKESKQQDLREQTVNYLKQELQRASKDVGGFTRWLRTIADSTDGPIVAAYKAMVHADLQSRSKLIDLLTETTNRLRKVEEKYGTGINKKKIFNSILEKDNKGNLTGYIISKFSSKFWKDRDNFFDELDKKDLSSEEKGRRIRDWYNDNAPLRKKEYNEARWKYLDDLKGKGKLSDIEYNEIEWSEANYIYDTPHGMHEKGSLNMEAADLISDWESENKWSYRDPGTQYKSKQWDQFNKLSSSDPMRDFYDHFYKTIEEINSFLPFQSRLKPGQLPSVMKTIGEKIAEGGSFIEISKLILAKQFDVLADDPNRTEQRIIDEQGNIRHFLPTFYNNTLKKYTVLDINSNKIDKFRNKSQAETFMLKNKGMGYTLETQSTPEDQSYDLPTILMKFAKMGYDYHFKNEILPEMEATRFFIENRKVAETDSRGNKVTRYNKNSKGDTFILEANKPKSANNLANQFGDWFNSAIYGIREKNEGSFNLFGLHVDTAKALNFLGKTTSLNLLALNVKAAISYAAISDAARIGETFAGEHMSKRAYIKAEKIVIEHLPGAMADIGRRDKRDLIGKLYEHFGISSEPIDINLRESTRLGKIAKTSSLYFLMKGGVFFTQTRLFTGMLCDKIAFDSTGKKLGDMIDMYHVDKNTYKLILDPKVDLDKSNWTEKEQENFIIKSENLVNMIHGEYGDLERSAIQQIALGRLGMMFRKFIVSGIDRRYKKGDYSERMGQYTEGYYRTTAKFMVNLVRDLKDFKLNIMSQEWDNLTPHEKANIIRTVTEVGFALSAMILSGVFLHNAKQSDQDSYQREMYSMLAYQTLRFKSEMLLYTPKLDEAMSILKSPAASMSTLETYTKVFSQLCSDGMRHMQGEGFQTIKSGKRKGQLKILKNLGDAIPGYRALGQTGYVQDQLQFMDKSMVVDPMKLFQSNDENNK